MAKVKLQAAFNNISGKLNKRDNTILRRKKYRAENGAVISYGSQEAYEVHNPRDYKKKPPKGAELRSITSFAEASRMTTKLIRAGKLTDEELAAMTEAERAEAEQLRQQLAHFKTRFMAQLKRPDPQAPVLKSTDPVYNHNSSKVQHRQYRTLNTFIRAILSQTLQTE